MLGPWARICARRASAKVSAGRAGSCGGRDSVIVTAASRDAVGNTFIGHARCLCAAYSAANTCSASSTAHETLPICARASVRQRALVDVARPTATTTQSPWVSCATCGVPSRRPVTNRQRCAGMGDLLSPLMPQQLGAAYRSGGAGRCSTPSGGPSRTRSASATRCA